MSVDGIRFLVAGLPAGREIRTEIKLHGERVEFGGVRAKSKQLRDKIRKRAKRGRSRMPETKAIHTANAVIGSTRLSGLLNMLSTRREKTQFGFSRTIPTVDCTEYRSGNQVYETLLCEFDRVPWTDHQYWARPESSGNVMEIDSDGEISKVGKSLNFSGLIACYYRIRSGNTENDDQVVAYAEREMRRLQKVRKSIVAVRAHQTRRKAK